MMRFVILRAPVAWAAPKISGKRTYDIRAKEKKIIILELKRYFTQSGFSGLPYVGPLRVDFFFEMPIPASFSKKKRHEMIAFYGDDFPQPHTKKPDLTNLRKLYEDCLQEAGIISNDSIITKGMTEKYYSPEPRVMIQIYSVDECACPI